MDRAEIGVEQRASNVAVDLQSAVRAVIEQAVGTAPRPALLAKKMGVSPSLAARVMRSVRADDPAGVLKDMPAPKGLGKLIEIAGRMGVEGEVLESASRSVEAFERLIDGFPTGRAGLHAAMAGHDESTRQRTTRDAIQNVFRSMTSLLGYHARQQVYTMILLPSRDRPDRCDLGMLLYKTGICRYRQGSRITVFGRSTNRDDDQPRFETLSGVASSSEPRDYMLEEQCSANCDRIEVFKTPDLHLFALPGDEPPLGESIDFCGAFVVRNDSPRHATGDKKWCWESIVPRIPTKELTVQLLVHDSIRWDREPELTTSLHGLNATWEHPDDPALELDSVDNWAAIRQLGADPRSLAIQGIPRYPEALASVLSSLNTDLEEFRAYGVAAQYPVPLIAQTIWIPLAEER